MNEQLPKEERVTEALGHLDWLTEFAYEKGAHELGYSPQNLLAKEIERLTAERDQYKQIAEINAETIKGMQAPCGIAEDPLTGRLLP